MFLVQHPQHPSTFEPQCHRRHPSAPPALIVQPTRTPGLLAMSKAAATTATSSRKASRSSPKTKHATAVAVMAPQQTPTKSLVAAAAKPVSTERQNRTVSSPESRRKVHCKRTQPSPAPQAEALTTDPFFSPPTIPNLSRPSGNLAKRRASQSNAAFPPALFTPGPFGGTARSAPTGLLTRSHFVVCDDSSDDDLPLSPPSTPVKNRRPIVDAGLAFEDYPSFKALNKPSKHKRQVSADVGGLIMGHWSGDEDSSPSSVRTFAPSTPSRVSTPGTIYDEDDIRYAMPKSHSSPLAGCLPRPAF